MQVGERARLAEAARAALTRQAAKLPDLELRTVTVPESGDAGTRLFGAIDRALADIPRSRLAGTIAITDGQVHDIPDTPPGGAPLNVLIPAKGEETDRRLRVIEAPSYGIVGKTVTLRVAIEDLGVPRPRRLGQPDDPPRRRAAARRERADRRGAADRGADHPRRPHGGGTVGHAARRRGLARSTTARWSRSTACATGCACC